MQLYINRDIHEGPWGGGNMWVQSFHKMMPAFGNTIATLRYKPTVIICAGLDSEDSHLSIEDLIRYKIWFRAKTNNDVKIILRVNECDARKNTNVIDKRLVEISHHIDGTIFVSDWMKEYFIEREWNTNHPYKTIINGVDTSVFHKQPKIGNGKINIVTHHWSDNPMKGFAIYEQLDRFLSSAEGSVFTFTYIGRDRKTFKNTKVIKPLFGKALGDELGKYDVYVSGSKFDPGPNHILEALACELPTYVCNDGGGCVEFVNNPNFVYDSWHDLYTKLLHFSKTKNAELNTMLLTSWEKSMSNVNDFISEVAA